MPDNIKQTAREILESGKAAVIAGYEKGTMPGRVQTLLAHTPEEADRFVFNEHCHNNLAVYLTKSYKLPKPVGIFAKPCDIKAITGLIQEKQIKREDVFIIGLSCNGMKSGDELSPRCRNCTKHNPDMCDVVLGEKVEENAPTGDPFARLTAFENKTADEKWQFWSEEFDKCIRCYACRQACPLCYCEQCIVDKTQPRWIDSSAHPVGNMAWHLIRAFHLAGRCIGCGECERVCQQNIPLGLLNMKMGKEIFSLYGYRTGIDPESKPPLVDFRMDDNQDFIR